MKFIIDTDMGIDDAVALLMALAYPQARIQAITTVAGNVGLAQATHNAGVVLDVAAAPAIPIYAGCARPLLQHCPEDATSIHGPDGLGGAARPTARRPEAEHAALALVRLARQRPGELSLVTLGPLTNVALAIRLDPHFPAYLNRLVIMGGAVNARGNTTPPAEFNISIDPEAAKIVFGAAGQVAGGTWLVSWETSVAYGVPSAVWKDLICGRGPVNRFVRQMSGFLGKVIDTFNWPAYIWPDPLAAAVALEPGLVTGQEHRFVDVETGWGLARGQTIVDNRPGTPARPNMHIVGQIDVQKFHALLKMAVQ